MMELRCALHGPRAAARGVMHGTTTAGEVVWVLLASAILVAGFAPLTVRLYHNRS